MSKLTDFAWGLIIGFFSAVIILCIITGIYFYHKREKELIDYAEKQMEIHELQEDVVNRDPVEFLEIPNVRRAADGAAAEYERKRDEILERFRSRKAD